MVQELVTSADQARDNIIAFEKELARNHELAEIMSYGRAWYAVRNADRWVFAPSKFVGYEKNSSKLYLARREERDGRITERLLAQWFEEVDADDSFYRELYKALSELFAQYGKSPNKLARLNVLKAELPSRAGQEGRGRSSRITMDAEICGGRPCIRGMRIRDSDILDMLAAGSDRGKILVDYPYLEEADIEASLEYAARAVDHRIVRAA